MGNGECAVANRIGGRIRKLLNDWAELPSIRCDSEALEHLRRIVSAVTAFEEHIKAQKERTNG